MSEWSDWKKWWMDLVKIALGAFLGTFLTVSVVAHFEDSRRRDAFAWQTLQAIRVSAIREFAKASNAYRLGAYDAAHDQVRGISPENSIAIRRYETDLYPSLEYSRRLVAQSFQPDDQALLIAFDKEKDKVFTAFNAAPLVPLGKLPSQCDNKEAVEAAWNGQTPIKKSLSVIQAAGMWKTYSSNCLDPVLKRYDQVADALILQLRARLAKN